MIADNGAEVREPLVLLPGLLCDATVWQPQIARFGKTREVIVPDYGNAPSIGAMATAALAQAKPRFALMGHSMGARVAMEIMRIAPERVTRLALLDTGTHPVAPGEEEKRMALLALGQREGMGSLVDAWLPPMVAPARRGDQALFAPLRAMAMAPGLAGFERQIYALLGRPDAAPILPTINCPTLIGVGAEDLWSPPSRHIEMASRIADATLEIFPDSGHMSPVEAPDAVNAAIAAWLEDQ